MNMGDERQTKLTRAIGNITGWLGSFPAIFLSVGIIALWAGGLPFISHGLQNTNYGLYINTFTTIITFIMVFIIQNTQNRDGKAVQVKLDAIIEHLGIDQATINELVGLEDAPEKEIAKVQSDIRHRAKEIK